MAAPPISSIIPLQAFSVVIGVVFLSPGGLLQAATTGECVVSTTGCTTEREDEEGADSTARGVALCPLPVVAASLVRKSVRRARGQKWVTGNHRALVDQHWLPGGPATLEMREDNW